MNNSLVETAIMALSISEKVKKDYASAPWYCFTKRMKANYAIDKILKEEREKFRKEGQGNE